MPFDSLPFLDLPLLLPLPFRSTTLTSRQRRSDSPGSLSHHGWRAPTTGARPGPERLQSDRIFSRAESSAASGRVQWGSSAAARRCLHRPVLFIDLRRDHPARVRKMVHPLSCSQIRRDKSNLCVCSHNRSPPPPALNPDGTVDQAATRAGRAAGRAAEPDSALLQARQQQQGARPLNVPFFFSDRPRLSLRWCLQLVIPTKHGDSVDRPWRGVSGPAGGAVFP